MQKLVGLSKRFDEKGIHQIKLKTLLELRSASQQSKQIKTMYPPIEIGSITLVDQIILLCLMELVAPTRILEIGTYQGFTTRLFLENSKKTEIVSIDLPRQVSVEGYQWNINRLHSDGKYNDQYLISTANHTGETYLTNLNERKSARLKLIRCNSTQIDYADLIGPIQLAFIDGGHDYETVTKDTNNVSDQMQSGVIIWHDYCSQIHPNVTRFLKRHSEKNQIFHIINSLCAFQILSPNNS